MKYLVIKKNSTFLSNTENPCWLYRFLTEYNPSLETFSYGSTFKNLNVLLNHKKLNHKKESPILFNNKEEAKKVAKIAKIYEIAENTDRIELVGGYTVAIAHENLLAWASGKVKLYVISDNGNEIEEIMSL